MMNKYESIIIINPNCTDEAIKALESKFTGLINENGKIESVEKIGKKRLAYEIKKNREGYYILFNFEAKPDSIAELERNYRITDEVLKFIVVRKED
jgi:small subunit ribosomal protein S6